MKDHKRFATTPPMGWNSWDCYGDSVNEEQLRGNAEYMAKYLKEYGWEYVVCDIQWSEPTADGFGYHYYYPLCMDEYSRLIPAENRFPSSAGGKGFGPIADYVHSLGLKFGIHIMRGIPRQAVHANCPIKCEGVTARDIAHGWSVCSWNPDMYGVIPDAKGAQEYYDSIFELYASWGVDYIKCDDICITEGRPDNLYSAEKEIEMLRKAIDNCGRDMVLSLSPGPAVLDKHAHLAANANMWRITGDFWDKWERLHDMFDRCLAWQDYVEPGAWPDCDMLPIGHICITAADLKEGRWTNFTHNEQQTMLSLWCIFRSPLMIGAEMRDNDEFTLSLLTNPDLITMLKTSSGARQTRRDETGGKGEIIWESQGENCRYAALFNTSDEERKIEFDAGGAKVYDIWQREYIDYDGFAVAGVHGVRLFRLEK